MAGLVAMRTRWAVIKLTLVPSTTHINLNCLKYLGSYPLIRSGGRGLGRESLGEKHVLTMQARHEALKCVDDLSVAYLPLQKVGFLPLRFSKDYHHYGNVNTYTLYYTYICSRL